MKKIQFLPADAAISEQLIWRKYLEMTERPDVFEVVLPKNLTIHRAENPTLDFYKYLYSATGLDLDWVDRLLMTDQELLENIQPEAVAIFVFYEKGCPAGYVELDFRIAGEIELKYFGLMPEFRDRGWGKTLLKWAINCAWQPAEIQRMHFSTCELDDARALPIYQSVGFRVFKETNELQRVIR